MSVLVSFYHQIDFLSLEFCKLISVGFYFIRCLHCPIKTTALSPSPCVSLCVEYLSLCIGAQECGNKTAHNHLFG